MPIMRQSRRAGISHVRIAVTWATKVERVTAIAVTATALAQTPPTHLSVWLFFPSESPIMTNLMGKFNLTRRQVGTHFI